MDYGNGFLSALQGNYPELENEAQAITLALLKGKTAKLAGQKGGNGLWFLQKNIFNGFRGELFIRSGNTLVQVIKQEETQTLDERLPYSYGANVFFNLKY